MVKKKKSSVGNFLGAWAFIIGLILAIVIALIGTGSVGAWAFILLLVLGLIVGLFNISDQETVSYLVAAIAFLFTFSALSNIAITLFNWQALATFFQLLNAFVAPAAAIVAIKALFKTSRN